ncbi:hypothetical protein PVAP13_1KG220000 [Panicum virgatum]|uniref:Uncharacterized protein n=1 Tax=Panicum virgatum TaxID=38727 RepID=A0A8T0XA36_PANVG|nr:hypothetical protein PVAP13_1KG220000 [Panicum virgatum]
MENLFHVFLMPPIPMARRLSFPFLKACEINIRRGRMRWPESSGMGTWWKGKLVCIPPTMEVEFGLGFPSSSHSYYS